jgi:5-methylcytosine-specific restriction endonuclease McrA
MKNQKLDAALVWKQLEDFVVPNLALNVLDQAVYSYLLRHSRLEGKPRLSFSVNWLARGVRLSHGGARPSIRRLIARGALRLVKCSKTGHLVHVLLPGEIPRAIPRANPLQALLHSSARRSDPRNFQAIDFMQNRSLRETIHARERGRCFYCLRHLSAGVQCIDHVVPQVQRGGNSYRNLVSCCVKCNWEKGEKAAADFLRCLYRDRRLTSAELAARFRALDDLAAGRLHPHFPASANSMPPRGRRGLHPQS